MKIKLNFLNQTQILTKTHQEKTKKQTKLHIEEGMFCFFRGRNILEEEKTNRTKTHSGGQEKETKRTENSIMKH